MRSTQLCSIWLFLWTAFFVVLTGCDASESTSTSAQNIVFRLTSDPGEPLKGVDLLVGRTKVATTGEDGVGKLSLTGTDGTSFDVFIACPEGYRSPKKPVQVLIKRLADPSKTPEYAASCPPEERTVVIAVRADGGPDLPILHLGREVARTDASGAAHLLFKVKPDDVVTLTLDTTGKGKERMLPQSPAESFTIKDQDEVVVMDQKFSLVPIAGRAVAKPRVPTSINRRP